MSFFKDCKYTRWYFSIIDSAKSQKHCYSEKHHIIPRSLGGSNDPSNLVRLSCRQHYICHILLTKMVDGDQRRKMVYALWMMNFRSKNQQRHMNGRWFEKCRLERAKLGVSESTKQKMSKSMLGKNKGRVASESTRLKQSLSAKARVTSDSTRKKISERIKVEWASGARSEVGVKRSKNRKWSPPMLGKTHSPETKKKMSESAKLVVRAPQTHATKVKRSASMSKLRWINRDGVRKRVLDVQPFVELGWSLGVK